MQSCNAQAAVASPFICPYPIGLIGHSYQLEFDFRVSNCQVRYVRLSTLDLEF